MLKRFGKKNSPCDRDSARFLLLLCLGREPYLDAELTTFEDQTFYGGLKRILKGDAFHHTLFAPFVLGRKPMALRFTDEQTALISRGMRRHFGIRGVDARLGTWPAALAVAATAPRFQKAFVATRGVDAFDLLQRQLADLGPVADINITGAVHQIAGSQVRGVALWHGNSDPLHLEFFLNGRPAGHARADQLNREAAAEFGAPDNIGFTHTLEIPAEGAEDAGATLLVFEHETGIMLCPPRQLTLDVRRPAGLLARTLDALEALERASQSGDQVALSEQLHAIEARLPLLADAAIFTLKDYDLYSRLYRPGPPTPTATAAFNILVAIEDGPEEGLAATQQSLDAQTYRGFDQAVAGAAIAGFDLVVPLTAGDRLDPQALAWFAATAAANPAAQIIRYGYDHYDEAGARSRPHFICRFDPLILEQWPAYATAFAYRPEAGNDAGTGDARQLWRQILAVHGPEAVLDLDQMLVSRPAALPEAAPQPLKLPEAEASQKLAIIIPTKDRFDLIRDCVDSLVATIEAPAATEIIIVDNGSSDSATVEWLAACTATQPEGGPLVRVIEHSQPFNWSEINNLAVRATDAELLLFLNDDTQAMTSGWDTVLRRLLAMPGAGVVGAKLLFPNGSVQHAGIRLDDRCLAFHEGAGEPGDAPGYLARLQLTRQCAAVTGAFLACERALFEALGGFDEEAFAVTFNDVDFCLRAADAGRMVVVSPDIQLYHRESESRGYDKASAEKARRARVEHDRLRQRWAGRFALDPWHPWRLDSTSGGGIDLLRPPTQS